MNTKKYFKIIIINLLCLTGCQSSRSGLEAPFQVQVLQTIPLEAGQDVSTAPRQVMAKASFRYLKDFDSLSGDYYTLVQGGELTVHKTEGSIVESEGFVGGSSPNLYFSVQNGVVIPKDYNTLAMLSSLYQYDTVISNLNDIAGVSMDEIQKKKGSVKILYSPIIKATGDMKLKVLDKLNAAYVPKYFQFLLMSQSSLEKIPISSNLQIITHEFGHLIWDYVFNQFERKEDDLIDSQYVIRGLNEGFADFLSYTLVGSTDILGSSFGRSKIIGQRNFAKIDFDYHVLASRDQKNEKEVCGHSFYCIGTLFARSLLNVQRALNLTASNLRDRGFLAREIISALKSTKAGIDLSKLSKDANGEDHDYNGVVLGSFFQSLLKNMADLPVRRSLCDQLSIIFGPKGFPVQYRTECPGK